ncbi:MAG: hypothetical protein HQL70_11570 [Magnetococcales bacterium]|nr:hypothetical protein [Magnetococcales bacterium]
MERVSDRRDFLTSTLSDKEVEAMQKHERTGQPLVDDRFLEKLEGMLQRRLKPRKAAENRSTNLKWPELTSPPSSHLTQARIVW